MSVYQLYKVSEIGYKLVYNFRKFYGDNKNFQNENRTSNTAVYQCLKERFLGHPIWFFIYIYEYTTNKPIPFIFKPLCNVYFHIFMKCKENNASNLMKSIYSRIRDIYIIYTYRSFSRLQFYIVLLHVKDRFSYKLKFLYLSIYLSIMIQNIPDWE